MSQLEKKFVKLKVGGTIFHDTSTGDTVSGLNIAEVRVSKKVAEAIEKNVLVVVTEEEYTKQKEETDAKVKEARATMGVEDKLALAEKENEALKKKLAEAEKQAATKVEDKKEAVKK